MIVFRKTDSWKKYPVPKKKQRKLIINSCYCLINDGVSLMTTVMTVKKL